MRKNSVNVPSARRMNSFILALVILSLSVDLFPQDITTSLKPVYSPEKKLYGYFDTVTSKLVIKHQFREAGMFHRGLAIVKKDSWYGIIDQKGKAVYPASSPEIRQNLDPDVLIIRESKQFKYGALDYTLKQVIPFEYDRITPIGRVFVVTRYGLPNQQSYEVSGIYNSKFELVVPVEIDSRLEEKVPGYISNTAGKRVGLITTDGEIIIPFDRNFLLVYKDAGIAMVLGAPNKWKVYRLDGTLASDMEFDDYRSIEDGFFMVKMNDKWGLFREKLVTQCIYDREEDTGYDGGTFILKKERKYGVTDINGQETVPYIYDRVSRYGNEMFLVADGDRYGLYNRSGKVIIPCVADSIPLQPVNNCFILRDYLGRIGCIAVDGSQIVPFVLDEEYVNGNYGSASTYLKRLLGISPDHPDLIFLDALGYSSRLNSADAIDHVNRIISGYNDSRNVPKGLYYLRSRLCADMNRFKEADEDAFRAIPSIYSHRAYMYLGDKMLKQEDLFKAQNYYHYAGLYYNREEAAAKEQAVTGEMKKRGLIRETASLNTGQTSLNNSASLPTTLMGFAQSDRMEYYGNYRFRRLFSPDEALADIPAGFRLPTREDWLKLIEYIVDDMRISSGYEYLAVRDIGRGWNESYTEEGVLQARQFTISSKDTYGLGISPLRSYNYTVETTDYQQRHDVITYWIEPSTHEGSRVNCIEITPAGFKFVNNASGKACVRYIKK